MKAEGEGTGPYYEFIAVLCGQKYTMPLGLVFGRYPAFFVYKSARMSNYLHKGKPNPIYLLSPLDPTLFIKSLRHELEMELSYREGCPQPDSKLGLWYYCKALFSYEDKERYVFRCEDMQKIGGECRPYSRAYGCIVELLVVLTKLQAGIKEPWFLEYARGLKWCVERSSNEDERLVSISDEILRSIEGYIG